MSRVAIIGGGISGLSAAHWLKKGGAEVQLFEAGSRLGGCVGTTRGDGIRFENGPAAIQGKCQNFRGLVASLGLESKIIYANDAARDRFLYFHGALHPLPRSLKDFIRTPLFTARQKFRVLLEPFVRSSHPETEETVAEFFGRRVGRGITMTWVDVVVSGTFAGNPNHLGIQSAFPELGRMERERGSIFRAMRERARERRRSNGTTAASPLQSLDGGLQTLIDRLESELGSRAHLNHRVKRLERRANEGVELALERSGGEIETARFDRVVLAAPAMATGCLLAKDAPLVADLLFEVEYASLLVAQASFDRSTVPGLPRGFGYLVPRCSRMRTLGWIFASELFPGVAPEGKVVMNGFIGGILDPHAGDLPDDMIQELMLGELALALGQRKIPVPDSFRVVRWVETLPQYAVGHKRRIAAVRTLLSEGFPEATIAGNWVDGVAIESCIGSGRQAADQILAMKPKEGVPA